MADNKTNQNVPELFQAGNRKIDKIKLENTLVSGIEPYIQTYQDQWGPEKTKQVRKAYSDLINAIHDNKVSMNIDGSLNVSDGSIINTPDKKGFDPVARAAYFVTSIINHMADYQEPKPETKKYNTDTFARNFQDYLVPPGTNLDVNNVWANLDDEIEDDEGVRSRPYTNRLTYFKRFLDSEITNLENYNEFDPYWKDKETLRGQLLELKEAIADDDISKMDTMLLAKLGFNPEFFSTEGTELTEEEQKARTEQKAKEEAEAAEATAKAQAEQLGRNGVLNQTNGIFSRDARTNPTGYENYLAKTYGTRQEGFDNINTQIQNLLDKAYYGSITGTNGLTADEKIQLGNFLYYIRTHNPDYRDAVLSPEEQEELQKYPHYRGGLNAFRLPWKTQDGRYIYADPTRGDIYYLKPQEHATYADLQGTNSQYKQEFLGETELGQQLAKQAQLSKGAFSDGNATASAMRAGAFIGDVIALGGGAANIVGSVGATALDLGANMMQGESIGNTLLDFGVDIGSAIIGIFSGGKAVKFARYAKYLPEVFAGLAAYGIVVNEEGREAITKLVQNPSAFTADDFNALIRLFRQGTAAAGAGRSIAARRKWGDLQGENVHKVDTKDGKEAFITKEQRAEAEKIGNQKGQKAAEEYLSKVSRNSQGQPVKDVELPTGTFKESPSGNIVQKFKTSRVPGTQKRPFGSRLSTTKETIHTDETAARLAKLREKRAAQKAAPANTLQDKWNRMAREMGWGVGKDNPGRYFDEFAGPEPPKVKKPYENPNTKVQEASDAMVEELKAAGFKPEEPVVATGEPAATPVSEPVAAPVSTPEGTPVSTPKKPYPKATIRREDYFGEKQLKEIKDELAKVRSGLNKEAELNALKTAAKEHITPGSIDANISKARQYVEGQPKLTPLLEKLINNTTWKEMITSKEFKKLTKNQKLVLERAYNMLFEKRGGKLTKQYKLGGLIPKYQGGGVSYNSNNWYGDVLSSYLQHILDELGNKNNTKTYSRWINGMQLIHSGLTDKASANGNDFYVTPYKDNDVSIYQKQYGTDPYAVNPDVIGYNVGISNAENSGRYNVHSPNPTSRDRNIENKYTWDGQFSGKTRDRTILGTVGDYTNEQLSQFQEQLKGLGYYMAPQGSHYYLGELDENGNQLPLNLPKYVIKDGELLWEDEGVLKTMKGLPAYPGAEVQQGVSVIPEYKTPDKINLEGTLRKLQAQKVWGEGDPYKKSSGVNPDILHDILTNGMEIGSMLGAIATTNANYKTAVEALRRFKPYDYAQQYHQLVDDYAGNQFTAEQAAKAENVRATTSDRWFNEAKALEGARQARDILAQQAVRNQDMIQKHIAESERLGNANKLARVETANKNNEALYNINLQKAGLKQQQRMANWTSVNNFLSSKIKDAKDAANERKQIRYAWEANQLGDRQSYIRMSMYMDPDYQKLRSYVAAHPEDTEAAIQLSNKTRELMYNYGSDWDQLYADTYGLQYNGPRYSPWDWFLRGMLSVPSSTPSTATPPIKKDGGTLYQTQVLRTRQADNDRFMKSIWKAIESFLRQKQSMK